MKKFFLMFFLAISFISCDFFFSEKKYPVIKYENSPQAFFVNFFEKETEGCSKSDKNNSDCSYVSYKFVESDAKTDFSKKFNDFILKRNINLLSFSDTQQLKPTLEEQAEVFLKEANQYEEPLYYEAFLEDTILLENKKLVSLKTNAYTFTGGAHGYGFTEYTNFKPNGEIYKFSELITNVEELNKVAKGYFMQKYNLTNEDISQKDGSFWFENQEFHLPQNVGFCKDSIYFHYNEYEIAPYASGDFSISIPLKEVQQWTILNN